MYKRTQNATHFLPRTGSFSTHPHRNCRVDVLPPDAHEPLYAIETQMVEARARLEQLREQREQLVERSYYLRGIDRLREKFSHAREHAQVRDGIDVQIRQIDEGMARVRKHLGSLQSLLSGMGCDTVERAFMRIAEAELSGEVFERLASKARRIVAAAK